MASHRVARPLSVVVVETCGVVQDILMVMDDGRVIEVPKLSERAQRQKLVALIESMSHQYTLNLKANCV